MTEDAGGGVAKIGVDELSGYDPMTEEGLPWELSMLYRNRRSFENRTICKMGVGLSSIRRSVVPIHNHQPHSYNAPEAPEAYHPPSVNFFFANSSNFPGSVHKRQLPLPILL